MAARKCPICGGKAELAPAEVLPFCSPTCKLIDLGLWLDGGYRVPGPPLEIENDGHELRNVRDSEDR